MSNKDLWLMTQLLCTHVSKDCHLVIFQKNFQLGLLFIKDRRDIQFTARRLRSKNFGCHLPVHTKAQNYCASHQRIEQNWYKFYPQIFLSFGDGALFKIVAQYGTIYKRGDDEDTRRFFERRDNGLNVKNVVNTFQ